MVITKLQGVHRRRMRMFAICANERGRADLLTHIARSSVHRVGAWVVGRKRTVSVTIDAHSMLRPSPYKEHGTCSSRSDSIVMINTRTRTA